MIYPIFNTQLQDKYDRGSKYYNGQTVDKFYYSWKLDLLNYADN